LVGLLDCVRDACQPQAAIVDRHGSRGYVADGEDGRIRRPGYLVHMTAGADECTMFSD